MGARFTTYVGSVFNHMSPLEQMTVLIHEILHVARPDLPLSATEGKEHNDVIRRACNTK